MLINMAYSSGNKAQTKPESAILSLPALDSDKSNNEEMISHFHYQTRPKFIEDLQPPSQNTSPRTFNANGRAKMPHFTFREKPPCIPISDPPNVTTENAVTDDDLLGISGVTIQSQSINAPPDSKLRLQKKLSSEISVGDRRESGSKPHLQVSRSSNSPKGNSSETERRRVAILARHSTFSEDVVVYREENNDFYHPSLNGPKKGNTVGLLMRLASFRKSELSIVQSFNQKQYELLNDKATYFKKVTVSNLKDHQSVKEKKKPKLRKILEKYQLVNEDYQTQFITKMLDMIDQGKKTKGQLLLEKAKRLINKLEILKDWIKGHWKESYEPIHPQSKKRVFWDVISIMLTLYECVFLPLRIAFNVTITGFVLYFELFKDMFFFFEILLNFHTSYISKGDVIRSHKLIAIHYLRNWFPFDMVVNFPFVELFSWFITSQGLLEVGNNGVSQSYSALFTLVKLLRIFKLVKFQKHVSKAVSQLESQTSNALASLFLLLFYVIFMAHLVACLWFFVGNFTLDKGADYSWILTADIQYASLGMQYTTSLYWAVTTMMTVGYGDLTAGNQAEKLVNIVIMLSGCGMFAYTMNSIGVIVQFINAESNKKRTQYNLVMKYLKKNGLSKEMQTKAKDYLEYVFENNKQTVSEDGEALALLSGNLRSEIKDQITTKVLYSNSLFKTLFGSRFLLNLSNCLEEKICSPGEIIFDQNDPNHNITFIATGTAEIFLPHSKQKIMTIGRGNCLGEVCFFSGTSPSSRAKALTFSSIFVLRIQPFLDLLENHKAEKEIFHHVRDELNLNQNMRILKQSCFGCGKSDHHLKACPTLHYVPDVEQVIKEYLSERAIFDRSFKRKKYKRVHVLRSSAQLKFEVTKFRQEKSHIVNEFNERKIVEVGQAETGKLPSTSITEIKVLSSPFTKYPVIKIESSNVLPEENYTHAFFADRTIHFESHHEEKDEHVKPETVLLDGNHEKDDYTSLNKLFSLKNAKLEDTIIFDTIKNFRFYFPHNNISKMIEKQRSEEEKIAKLQALKNHVDELKSELSKVMSASPLSASNLGLTPSGNLRSLGKKNSIFNSYRSILGNGILNKQDSLTPAQGSFSERVESVNNLPPKMIKKSGSEKYIKIPRTKFGKSNSQRAGLSIFNRERSMSQRSDTNESGKDSASNKGKND